MMSSAKYLYCESVIRMKVKAINCVESRIRHNEIIVT